jgi:hypothetical protein
MVTDWSIPRLHLLSYRAPGEPRASLSANLGSKSLADTESAFAKMFSVGKSVPFKTRYEISLARYSFEPSRHFSECGE